MTRLRLASALALLSLFTVAAYAQRQMTVAQLIEFIKSSIKMRQDDRQVAGFVHKIRLTNRLDDRTIEDLQSLGAGPNTVAALRTLGDESAKLAPPPPAAPKPAPVVIPAPDSVKQREILDEVTRNALNYTKSLPNFLCTQVTRQHLAPLGSESWSLVGTIQEHLAYVDGKEDYKVVMVDDKPVSNVGHMQVQGNKSSGEFGTMLSEIFAPSSHTQFGWDHWGTLRGRRMYVFNYRVLQENSKYSIEDEQSRRTIVPGYHGLVYADRDTGMVMRIVLQCENIPPDFPVQDVSETLDYDFADISGQKFVLPLHADLHSRGGRVQAWNELEFRLYRKFSTESTITFDTPDAPSEPISPDKLKETPDAPQSGPADGK